MDITQEAVDQWKEYAAEAPIALDALDTFEAEYHAYLRDESEKTYSPAISVADLFKRPAPVITSYVPGFVYAGSLNLVAGEPKVGKTTLNLHLLNAISLGRPFLGGPVRKTNVLYVSEQNELSLRQELEDIPETKNNPSLFLLMPEKCPPDLFTWTQRLKFWKEKAEAVDAGVLAIDTYAAFAGLPIGGENDSACNSERMMALRQLFASRPSLGIVLVHHIRKPAQDRLGGPQEFASLRDARGSSAIVGSVDHCVMVTKHPDKINKRVRGIHIEGRFCKEDDFYIELADTEYKYWHSFAARRR